MITSFPKRYLHHVLSSSRIREYDPGETLIREGEQDPWIFILLSGRISIRKSGKTVASIEEAGQIFGELAVINKEPRSASVQAETASVCLSVDWSFVDELSERDKHSCCLVIYRLFINILSERLKGTTQALAEAEEEITRLKEPINEGPAA